MGEEETLTAPSQLPRNGMHSSPRQAAAHSAKGFVSETCNFLFAAVMKTDIIDLNLMVVEKRADRILEGRYYENRDHTLPGRTSSNDEVV
jgi:hypothetical protein